MPPETAPDDDESALLSRIDDLRIASIRPLMPAACLIEHEGITIHVSMLPSSWSQSAATTALSPEKGT
ncbi:hypothetical protein EMIHUDRAFT_201822 [Emiliania huxleyi CCMP1516]|uniref:MIP18 family-like domain-containing protein n=2 Tax=Emiliania huxleyi TaxID=2903 RepID=A0A0D3KEJ9_EMIH1|nr:hypothetical protein EMIHUDRAFT_201822 [Emiliania huxleyi CCMP1516]EOD34184.1 hypothetical protein EMIHUDRAFT_201822 [Emiliania huxleyi CCMP1516]|eukprot:XP_005786613.1 hypothetical protein EMIHUDRAFT_201822 [Emiliania huxleyi CCMP1516]